eukprot:1207995-Rhodomonas_salina.1
MAGTIQFEDEIQGRVEQDVGKEVRAPAEIECETEMRTPAFLRLGYCKVYYEFGDFVLTAARVLQTVLAGGRLCTGARGRAARVPPRSHGRRSRAESHA